MNPVVQSQTLAVIIMRLRVFETNPFKAGMCCSICGSLIKAGCEIGALKRHQGETYHACLSPLCVSRLLSYSFRQRIIGGSENSIFDPSSSSGRAIQNNRG